MINQVGAVLFSWILSLVIALALRNNIAIFDYNSPSK